MLSSRSAPTVVDQDQSNYVTAEFSRLCQDPVDGVYVVPLYTNYLIWKGFIMVRSGCYSGGTFRFTLTLPKEFPDSPLIPIVTFDSPLFHPYVDPANQELNLQGCFPTKVWKRDKNKIIDILLYLQEIFAVLTENFPLDPNSLLNQMAANLFSRDYDNFQLRAEEIIAFSINQSTVYDPPNCLDPHVIIFSPWEHAHMEPIRRKLIGKPTVKTSTDSSSRTVSDFSAKTDSNGGDADDERAELALYGSPSSRRSSFEINFRGLDLVESGSTLSSRRMPTHEFSDLSSIDLESQPASARDSIIVGGGENGIDLKANDNGFGFANGCNSSNNEYKKHQIHGRQCSLSHINESYEDKDVIDEEDEYEGDTLEVSDKSTNACWSENTLMAKSMTESLHQNDENEIDNEPINREPVAFKIGTDSSSSTAELTDDPENGSVPFTQHHSQNSSSPIITPRGVDARSVSLFSNALE